MTTRMCPILSSPLGTKGIFCEGQKCAWWDANVETCAVLNTSVKIDLLLADFSSALFEDSVKVVVND